MREREAAAIADDARRRIADVAKREHNVRERERTAEREARQDARRYLLDARAEIDRTIKGLKSQGADAIDAAGREARQRAEELAAKQSVELERLEREETNVQRRVATPAARRDERVEVGDSVAVATLGGKVGRLMEIRDGDAVVAVGAIKMTVPRKVAESSRSKRRRTPSASGQAICPRCTFRRRSIFAACASTRPKRAVLQALDAAVRADLRRLRIIHGKGTGALRERVTEMLQKDTRVKEFRLGAWNEGGAGVTMAEFA